MILHYLLEALLTAFILPLATLVTCMAIDIVRRAHRAIHRKS